MSMGNKETTPSNFIRNIIDEDLRTGKHKKIVTRFPPEPNGYLHIGHAKSICLNFGLAEDYGGTCHLRFDDTNPEKEEIEYIESIQEDVRWLGFDWGEHLYYASDYFEQLYGYAVKLIKMGKAYVCSLTQEEIREYRGTLTKPGKNSPYRDRSIEENLDLFRRMREGEFDDGAHVLRAKIDMAAPNVVMRDPILYRIRKVPHHRTGDDWCIYPMYDFTHCLSDAIEGITHSLCTLEFENNRPLYEWILEQVFEKPHPQQIEFARLNISYTLMSKRKLLDLIQRGIVDGWDDPRMPTLVGLRRRGYTPAAIRDFSERIGVAKANSVVDAAMLENSLREDLNRTSQRRLAVLRPLKVVIENYPEGQVEELEAVNNPNDPDAGVRLVPFSREIYIEREDFMEDPPKKFFRLAPGREVRLRFAYFITCTDVIKDEDGSIVEIRAVYDPETKGGSAPDGRKVKGTIHWVSAEHALPAEVRLYDHLFLTEDPNEGDLEENVNPNSLEILKDAKVEPSLGEAEPEDRFQFERQGYFCVDWDSTKANLVFNLTVPLRDTWARMRKK
ncbi:MAG TPA: glutamine--tRNA ligase/YqeY domain fusion protein [Firmicutes bacterium]|nr:glutamine--tRNA ligase/YqeY domain fusion protein [Bacillota bacterium]